MEKKIIQTINQIMIIIMLIILYDDQDHIIIVITYFILIASYCYYELFVRSISISSITPLWYCDSTSDSVILLVSIDSKE